MTTTVVRHAPSPSADQSFRLTREDLTVAQRRVFDRLLDAHRSQATAANVDLATHLALIARSRA